MHKATFLEGTLRFTITPDGPILVKAGESSGVDPVLPDMRFVRSQDRIYIPGPSLKGVIRAQAERICRSLDGEHLQRTKHQAHIAAFGQDELRLPLADNPLGSGTKYSGLEDMDYSSGRAIEDMKLSSGPERTAIVYRRSSFVSQIFGHTSLAGRVRFADAMPVGEIVPEERNGVAIDRIYGSVAVGPFNYEVVVGGAFTSRIDFKNLTLAQIALLGLSLRDLAEGRVGIGFGKSRGLGRVKVNFDQMILRYPTCELASNGLTLWGQTKPVCAANQFAGLGAFGDGEAYKGYALPTEDITYLPEGLKYIADELMGVELKASTNEQVKAIWRSCMPAWKRELGI